jgi:hypothetical protein
MGELPIAMTPDFLLNAIAHASSDMLATLWLPLFYSHWAVTLLR